MKNDNISLQNNGEIVDSFANKYSNNFAWEHLHFTENENQVENFVFEAVVKLSEFSTDFADAFPVTEIKNQTNTILTPESLYVLVFKRNVPLRLNEILNYGKNHNAHDAPIAYGLTRITNLEGCPYFVVVLPKPRGKNLKQITEAGVRLDENFIYKKLLPPVTEELKILHERGIIHGRINLENIFIDQDGKVRLGECISDLCGYSQVAFFEPIERAQSQPIGRGEGGPEVDCYAIGILIHALLTGHNFWELEVNDMVRKKLHRGTYDFLVNHALISGRIGELVKGLTADIPDVRWGIKMVESYMHDSGFNFLAPTDLNYFNRAIIFNHKECYSKRALAHELVVNWENAKSFIRTDKIKKWLEPIVAEEKFYDYLDLISSGSSTRGILQKAFDSDEEALVKVIIALDPLGPIRIRDISFQKAGIGAMLIHSVNNSQGDRIQLISGFLMSNIISIYDGIKQFYPNIDILKNTQSIKKCSEFMLKNSIGFGIDRCLYELNPTLICQYPGVLDGFILSAQDFFKYIEQSSVLAQQVVCQKPVGGFLASKINLKEEIKIKELFSYETITKTRAYQTLMLLVYAQKVMKIPKIPNIAQAIANQLQEVIDTIFRGKSIKANFIRKLQEAAKTGSIGDIAKVICNTELYRKDADGYAKALRRGAEIAFEIFSFNDRTLLYHDTKRKSLNLALRFSYLASLFMLLSLILKGI